MGGVLDLGKSDVLADRPRPEGPPEEGLDDFSDVRIVRIDGGGKGHGVKSSVINAAPPDSPRI
jgi:hypothetical protein